MTEINGLRLAYRGFVGGLAGGYAWAAIAMTLGAILFADPLRPLQPIALAITPLASGPELAFVLGFAAIQIAGAFIGMCFAYFFGRFFTLRLTLAAATPLFAVLAWATIASSLARLGVLPELAGEPAAIAGAVGYGLLLGGSIPVRTQLLRGADAAEPYSGSPST